MSTATFTKSPDAALDYTVDWSQWLVGGDTISSATWTVPAGLSQPKSATATSTTTTVWIGSGTLGTSYDVKCLVSTVAGRSDARTITVTIASR